MLKELREKIKEKGLTQLRFELKAILTEGWSRAERANFGFFLKEDVKDYYPILYNIFSEDKDDDDLVWFSDVLTLFDAVENKHKRFLSKGVVNDWLKKHTLAEPTNEVITVIQTFVAKEVLGE